LLISWKKRQGFFEYMLHCCCRRWYLYWLNLPNRYCFALVCKPYYLAKNHVIPPLEKYFIIRNAKFTYHAVV
jgi:hypothetical protein